MKLEIERSYDGDLYKNFGLVITKDGEEIGSQKNYEIKILKRKLTLEEANELLQRAIEEIDSDFRAGNKDLNHVMEDVNPKDSYVDGRVTAEWSFDNYDYLSLEGVYNRETARVLDDLGEIIKITVCLKCQEYSNQYEFFVKVLPPEYSLEESIKDEIQNTVNRNVEGVKVVLPETVVVDDITYNLKWSNPSFDSLIFIFMAIAVMALLVWYEKREKLKRDEQKRKIKLQMEYPDVVSEFALLTSAGMNIRTVLKEISKAGEHKEIKCVLTDIENGFSEYQAFYRMADRCDLKCYRRFASLVTQNIKLGGRHLSKMLMKESENAYEERKNLAIRMGEEAGTKMMIPMLLMLGIVLTITILPAFFSMKL